VQLQRKVASSTTQLLHFEVTLYLRRRGRLTGSAADERYMTKSRGLGGRTAEKIILRLPAFPTF
jgi:hypothetical protein